MEFEAQGRRMLVIVAHPDDAEFTSGGTVARWTQEGGEAYYLVCTDGAAGGTDPSHTPEWLRATREREQHAAADHLGVKDVNFLGYRDGELTPMLELRKAIARCVRALKPDVTIIPSPERTWVRYGLRIHHPDHLAVGEAALAALYPGVGNAWTFRELLDDGLEPHTVPEIWISNTNAPDYPVDISGTVDRKVEAIMKHTSQMAGRDSEEIANRMKPRAQEVGAKYGMAYAEEYLRIIIDW